MVLGEQIKTKRIELNLTQQELAEKMYVSRQTISNWELSKSYPDIESLILLSEVFSLTVDELLKEDLQVVESLKKTSIWEIMFMLGQVSLALASLLCLLIDFILNRHLSWSVIVTISCLIPAVFLAVLRHSSSNQLIKFSLLISPLIYCLFWSITLVAPVNLINILAIGSLWLIYYWIILLVFVYTKLNFWYWLAFVCGLSILTECLMDIFLYNAVFTTTFLISNSIELVVIGIFIFCGLTSIDNQRIDNWIKKLKLKRGG